MGERIPPCFDAEPSTYCVTPTDPTFKIRVPHDYDIEECQRHLALNKLYEQAGMDETVKSLRRIMKRTIDVASLVSVMIDGLFKRVNGQRSGRLPFEAKLITRCG